MENQDLQIQELEKTIRILRKKLERSEKERSQIEAHMEAKEFLLKQVIAKLQESQQTLEQRSHDLEIALADLNAMQVQLIQSEKMSALGNTVAGIAHEINNPIGFIYGNLRYLTEHTQNLLKLLNLYERNFPEAPAEICLEREAIDIKFIEEDLPKIVQSMQVGSQRIRDIVLALRNFARLDEVGYKSVDINEGIENTLMVLQPKLANIQVIKQYGELPLVKCAAGDLNQVFMNIFLNAIDAIAQKNTNLTTQDFAGEISIRTQLRSDRQVAIEIADNGVGIPTKVMNKVFDTFFTTKVVGKGTGLGLAIARQIVAEKHGGNIEVDSQLGQGTTFTIQLPIDSQSMKCQELPRF
ncbi:MAG: ATP-binding protein [Oscillatoriaceae cyanobacterium Prado104]|jgi:signal transduction histidine kinase|nr:ATP-binding protein [Oscillatoriaceae cyanobacterium Prado104]